jgi:hypothetical protein
VDKRVLTIPEIDRIEDEIHQIAEEVEWLDPNIPGERARLDVHFARLEELEKILLTSIKKHRIQKSGLKVLN